MEDLELKERAERYPLVVSLNPYMVTYYFPYNDVTVVLFPPWEQHVIDFIRFHNIQPGEELRPKILIPQWAESLSKKDRPIPKGAGIMETLQSKYKTYYYRDGRK